MIAYKYQSVGAELIYLVGHVEESRIRMPDNLMFDGSPAKRINS